MRFASVGRAEVICDPGVYFNHMSSVLSNIERQFLTLRFWRTQPGKHEVYRSDKNVITLLKIIATLMFSGHKFQGSHLLNFVSTT